MELFTRSLKLPYASSSSFLEALDGVEAIDYFFAKQILLHINKNVQARSNTINVNLSFHLLLALSCYQRKGSVCLPIHDIANRAMWERVEIPEASHTDVVHPGNLEGSVSLNTTNSGFLFPGAEVLLTECENLIALCASNTFLHFEKGLLYSRRYYVYESQFCEFVSQRIKQSAVQSLLIKRKTQKETIQTLLSLMFQGPLIHDKQLDIQQFAIINSVCSYFSVITGGAGTGKTYTIARLLLLLIVLDNLASETIALLAPTGKAANRLKQSLYKELANLPDDAQIKSAKAALRSILPSTVHNFLKIDPIRGLSKYTSVNPLPVELVIVDESSMVDLSLMNKIISAMPPQATLILVGDANQLPSVENGSLLADLVSISNCRITQSKFNDLRDIAPQLGQLSDVSLNNFIESQAIPHINQTNEDVNIPLAPKQSTSLHTKGWVSQLIVGKRSNDNLNALSYAILKGDKIAIENAFELPEISFNEIDFTPVHTNFNAKVQISYAHFSPELQGRLKQQFSILLNANSLVDGHEALNNYALLSPYRRGHWGVEYLNLAIENLLSNDFPRVNKGHYKGKPIMIMVNDYQLGLFNGDIGMLWPDQNGELKAYFAKRDNGLSQKLDVDSTDGDTHTEQAFVAFPIYTLPKYETTYAMTIHKTQGSEYNQVDLVLPESKKVFLNKQLIYTGITRAKECIGIWSTKSIFYRALTCEANRVSGVSDRLS